jgi:hypothetical protein
MTLSFLNREHTHARFDVYLVGFQIVVEAERISPRNAQGLRKLITREDARYVMHDSLESSS